MKKITISTERLLLIAADKISVEMEMKDLAHLSKYLNAVVPGDWPPPLNDENSAKWFLEFLRRNPNGVGWGMWYFCEKSKNILIGNGGFKGKPDANGSIEIGYSIIPDHQKKGFATEAVTGLVNWAFSDPKVKRIIAHTLPELQASINVLLKSGFDFAGEGDEMGTIRFILSK